MGVFCWLLGGGYLGTGEIPGGGEASFGEEEVDIGQTFHRKGETVGGSPELLRELGLDRMLDVVVLSEEVGIKGGGFWVVGACLQLLETFSYIGEVWMVGVIYIEMRKACVVGVEEREDIGEVGQREYLLQAERLGRTGDRSGGIGYILHLEELYLVDDRMLREVGDGALRVVEAHEMVLDFGDGVKVVRYGDDTYDGLEIVEFGVDGLRGSEEREVEESTTAGSGDEVEGVDDVLETRIGLEFIAEHSFLLLDCVIA